MKIHLSVVSYLSNRNLEKEVYNTGRRTRVLHRGRMCNSNSLICATFFNVHFKSRLILKSGATSIIM